MSATTEFALSIVFVSLFLCFFVSLFLCFLVCAFAFAFAFLILFVPFCCCVEGVMDNVEVILIYRVMMEMVSESE